MRSVIRRLGGGSPGFGSALAILTFFLLLTGCAHQIEKASKGTQTYSVKGVVREISLDGRSAVIRHEEVPGYMPAMTMEFRVLEPMGLQGISAGDTVTFQLVATEETHWIEDVRREGAPSEWVAQPFKTETLSLPSGLKTGDAMPDHSFLTEDGKQMKLSDFRGKVLAFTFIFTRCPLPDYCPRMSRSFEQARRYLRADGGPANWQFLSLSFDPEHDTPRVLKRHAPVYRGDDRAGWLFGAVSTNSLAALELELDLMVKKEAGSFAHNLRTVVLDPAGRIREQFIGNSWTAKELAESMRAAKGP